MRFAFAFTLFTTLTGFALAQQPIPFDRRNDHLPYDLYLEAMRQNAHQAELEQQREARRQEMIFVHQANRFAELWTRFTREFNERGTVNVKAARQMVKAFHQLEKSGAWPGSR